MRFFVNKHRLGFTVAAFFLSLSPQVLAGENLTIAEALEHVNDSSRVKAAQAKLQISQATVTQAKGMFLPNASIRYGVTVTNDPVGVFSAKLQQRDFQATDFNLPNLNHPDDITNWAGRLELRQPVIHSTTDIHRLNASKYEESAEQHRLIFSKQHLRLQVAWLYLTAVAAKEIKQVYEQGISRLQGLENKYELLDAPTSATTTNYLITQAVRYELEAKRASLSLQEENTIRSLLALIDQQGLGGVTLSDPLPAVAPIESSKESTQENRADVLAAEESIKAAQSARKAAKSMWGPHVDVVAGYNFYTRSFDDIADSYDAGIFLTWPFFSGNRIGAQRKSVAEAEHAKAAQQRILSETKAALENATAQVKTALKQHALSVEGAIRADKAVNLARKRYAQGSLPLVDFSRAIQTRILSHENRIHTQLFYGKALYQIKFERGEL